MSSAGDRQRSSREAQAPDPAPSQLCEDVKTETSGRGTEVCVKKEETLELNIYSHGEDFDNTPEVISIKEEEADSEDYLYCEVCKSYFFNKCLGVFNKGETVPVGAHFGPYQGELVDREEAMNSGYSWVIYRSGQCEEYIDAKREMHANWMRYVNCARNEEEQNLVAFNFRGGILYRCCRPINPGQELLVWYEEDYAKDLGHTFDCLWNKKCSANGKV
ncbi:hypothetical protein PDJAM_G00207520 [Pangasius djambal]|uniref:Uncharacterized protein n=1 Tax=Pangasius djambal TaxID=1691987 RepID=A0ACC5Y9T7_9TELE|nr:hypothetical protein [Pangasius djambal]